LTVDTCSKLHKFLISSFSVFPWTDRQTGNRCC